jgi:hypothetical protein
MRPEASPASPSSTRVHGLEGLDVSVGTKVVPRRLGQAQSADDLELVLGRRGVDVSRLVDRPDLELELALVKALVLAGRVALVELPDELIEPLALQLALEARVRLVGGGLVLWPSASCSCWVGTW